MTKKFSFFNLGSKSRTSIACFQFSIYEKGFTLIELLVVISIIGILAGLTLSSYSGAQKQARDSQRRSDLNQYRNGLEVYAGANNLKYPSYTSAGSLATTMCSDKLQPTGIMSSCPTDPVTTYSYYYLSDGTGSGTITGTQYVLWATMETGGYWEVCSNGKAGKVTAVPTDSVCDL